MGNTASAITCYPLKTGVMQGRLAVEGVMVISYFLCRVRHSVKHFSPSPSVYRCVCECVCVCNQVCVCRAGHRGSVVWGLGVKALAGIFIPLRVYTQIAADKCGHYRHVVILLLSRWPGGYIQIINGTLVTTKTWILLSPKSVYFLFPNYCTDDC